MKTIYIVDEESFINNDFHRSVRAAFKNKEDAIAFISKEIINIISDESESFIETFNLNYDYEVSDKNDNYIGWTIIETKYYEIY